jgi:hypothetical protein
MTCKGKCGCADTALITPPSTLDTIDCPNKELCPETFSGSCIVYTGNNIVDTNINYGDRYDIIVQKLALLILNPDNINNAVPYLKVSEIGSTTATVTWKDALCTTGYVVEHKLPTDIAWTSSATLTNVTSYSLTGLLSNTVYQVRIMTNCGVVTEYYSITVDFTTKTN